MEMIIGGMPVLARLPRRAFVQQVMGLPVSIHVRGPAADSVATAALVAEVFADLHRIDRLFSTYREDSEIAQINAGHLSLAEADPLVRAIHDLAEIARERTGGRFNIHLPDQDGVLRLDPSGIVKGWAAQQAFDKLAQLGQDLCVNAGGDVVVGTAAGGPAWRIGIEKPDGTGILEVVTLAEGAVATSGTRARGYHLIDPRDGSRPRSLLQLSVVGPSLVWADVLATAGFVHGTGVTDWLAAEFDGYQALGVDATGAVTNTTDLRRSP